MKKSLLASLCLVSTLAFGQGAMAPPNVAFRVVNGLTQPIANATVTVCAAGTGGIPCSPALVGAIYSNTALSLPLTNPFFADASGNYQFAAAAGTYTVTVTASGFAGNSYQLTLGAATGGGSGSATNLENCTPDQTGNSFYTVAALTNYFNAHWEFVPNTTTYINCQIFVPTPQTGATLVLDIYSADSTAGHTASFQTCDLNVTSGGTMQAGALTCAGAQTYTTTATAYQRITLTFNVQSTLTANGILIVKLGVAPSGTQPASNMFIYPHFIL